MNINDQRKRDIKRKAINEMNPGTVFVDEEGEIMMVIREFPSGEFGAVSLENGNWYPVDHFCSFYEILNATVVIED